MHENVSGFGWLFKLCMAGEVFACKGGIKVDRSIKYGNLIEWSGAECKEGKFCGRRGRRVWRSVNWERYWLRE